MRVRDRILIMVAVIVIGGSCLSNFIDWKFDGINIPSCVCPTIEEPEEVPSLELVPNTMSAGH